MNVITVTFSFSTNCTVGYEKTLASCHSGRKITKLQWCVLKFRKCTSSLLSVPTPHKTEWLSQRGDSPFVYRDRAGWPASLPGKSATI